MKVNIRSRNMDVAATLRAYVDRRLHFALDRFEERIAKVTVRFADANGVRGGVDKQCRMDVALHPTGHVMIEDVDANLRTAIDRVANRAGQAVPREIQRRAYVSRP